MVIGQAAVVNLKSINPSIMESNNTYSGKIISYSKGVLSIQVGSDIFNLQMDQGDFKVGETVSFILSESQTKAQVLIESSSLPSDNLSLSISSEMKDLLSIIDSLLKQGDVESKELKMNLHSLLSILKKGVVSQKKLSEIIGQLTTVLKDNQNTFSSSNQTSVLDLILKLEKINADKSSFLHNSLERNAINNIKENVINTKGQSQEKLIFLKDRFAFKQFVQEFGIDNKEIAFSNKSDFNGSLVHLSSSKDNDLTLNIFSGNNTEGVLTHIAHKSFESPFMRDQMPLILPLILEKNEELNIQSLKTLDTIIAKNFGQFNSNLSSTSLSITVSQLLSTIEALGEEKLTVIEKLIPQMMNSLKEDIKYLLMIDNSESTDKIEKVFSNISTNFEKGGKEFFESLFKLIGLNQENVIASNLNSESGSLKGGDESLKTILSQLLSESVMSDKNTEKKDVKSVLEQKQTLFSVPQKDSAEQPVKSQLLNLLNDKIENVINKIEAIQILANKVPSVNGESQLITIPVNINNEWAEIKLQFKKEKSNKNKAGSESTSILLNIELSVIGEVSADMKFFKNRDLSINMMLSNRPTYDWFIENKPNIIKSLMGYNFKSVKVDFGELKKDNHDTKSYNAETDDGRFDVRA